MEDSKILREQIFEIVDNQLKAKDPPETKETYDRLKKEGFTDLKVKQMIGACLAVEIFNVIKHGRPYNNDRYIRYLHNLPTEP